MTEERKANKRAFLREQLEFFFPKGKTLPRKEWEFLNRVWHQLAIYAIVDGLVTEAEADAIYAAYMA